MANAAHFLALDDLESFRPGSRKSFYDWFVVSQKTPSLGSLDLFLYKATPQYYKVIKGNGKNVIIGNKFQDAPTMISHIQESHEFWLKLMRGQTKKEKINRDQTSNPRWCKTYVAALNATSKFGIPAKSNILPPAERPAQYDNWYYLDAEFNIAPGQTINE